MKSEEEILKSKRLSDEVRFHSLVTQRLTQYFVDHDNDTLTEKKYLEILEDIRDQVLQEDIEEAIKRINEVLEEE